MPRTWSTSMFQCHEPIPPINTPPLKQHPESLLLESYLGWLFSYPRCLLGLRSMFIALLSYPWRDEPNIFKTVGVLYPRPRATRGSPCSGSAAGRQLLSQTLSSVKEPVDNLSLLGTSRYQGYHPGKTHFHWERDEDLSVGIMKCFPIAVCTTNVRGTRVLRGTDPNGFDSLVVGA